MLKQQHQEEIDDLQYDLALKEEQVEKLEMENNQQKMELTAKTAAYETLQRTTDSLIGKSGHTTNNNNTTNNIYQTLVVFDLSQERLEKIFDKHYTRRDFQWGVKGLGMFVVEHVIVTADGRFRVGLSDFNRGTIVFIHPERGVIRDGKCRQLIDMVYGPCMRRVDQIIKDENIVIHKTTLYGTRDDWANAESKAYRELQSIKNDNRLFVDEMIKRAPQV